MELSKEELRYEKKWVYLEKNKNFLLNYLKKGGFFFINSFPIRYVNNLYYDTKDLKSLTDNLDGVSFRQKLRVRWYGDFYNAKNLFVERKIKKNQLGKKKIKKIDFSIDFNNFKNIEKLNNYIETNFSLIKDPIKPTLFNRYKRIYTVSKICPDVRCTLDFNLQSFVYNPIIGPKLFKSYPYLILEIKYPSNKDFLVKKVLNYYNLKRISKSSKYVTMYLNEKFF